MNNIKTFKAHIDRLHKVCKVLKGLTKQSQRSLSNIERSSAECPLVWSRNLRLCFPQNYQALSEDARVLLTSYLIIYSNLTGDKPHKVSNEWIEKNYMKYIECKDEVSRYLFGDVLTLSDPIDKYIIKDF